MKAYCCQGDNKCQHSTCDKYPNLDINPVGKTASLQATLNIKDNEKSLIRKALITNRGNVTRAADDLGIDRNALYRRMKKYGIQ